MPRKRAAKAGGKKSAEEKTNGETSFGNTLNQSKKSEKRKYQHRILESNWAKYDEDQNESTQGVGQTAATFDTLITQSGKGVSTFQFKDDKIIESEKHDLLQNQQEGKKGILGFNLETASAHIRNIPIFIKLELQNVCNLLDNEGCKWHGEYFQELKNDIKMPKIKVKRKRANVLSELKWDFSNYVDYEQSINSILQKIKELSMNNETVGERRLTFTAMMGSHSNVLKDDNDNDDSQNIKLKDPENLNDDDDELESLLAVKTHANQSNAIVSGSLVSESSIFKEDTEEKILDRSDTNDVEKKDMVNLEKKANESLEEWLDSILD